MAKEYPDWIDRRPSFLLREVASNIYVGGAGAASSLPWFAIIDLCGASVGLSAPVYNRASILLRWHFDDGTQVPDGLLESVIPLVDEARRMGPVLIHCRAGLSRSASVAYAALRMLVDLPHGEAMRRIYVSPGWPMSSTIESARSWVFEEGASNTLNRDWKYNALGHQKGT